MALVFAGGDARQPDPSLRRALIDHHRVGFWKSTGGRDVGNFLSQQSGRRLVCCVLLAPSATKGRVPVCRAVLSLNLVPSLCQLRAKPRVLTRPPAALAELEEKAFMPRGGVP